MRPSKPGAGVLASAVVDGQGEHAGAGFDGRTISLDDSKRQRSARVRTHAGGQTQCSRRSGARGSSSSGSARGGTGNDAGTIHACHLPSSDEPVLHGHEASAPVAPGATAPSPVVASTNEPELHTAPAKQAAPAAPARASSPALKDPSPQEIQHIIQEFAAKEKVFREARNNYTYHQINKVQEFGPDNQIVGTFEEEWDILYDDSGKRIEKVTYAPVNSLKNLIMTKEDYEGFRNIQPFVFTTDELPEYEITYLGHVAVDEITAYVFRIRPKEIEKNKQYFQGEVWVDDHDLQIVKSNGKQVPQDKTHHGQENLSRDLPPGASRWMAISGFPPTRWRMTRFTSPTPLRST